MKNKLQKLFSVGLLSASAVYISMALMATGCSSDNSSVTEGDTEEYTEVAESINNEDVESSDIEETSKTGENSKAEKSSNDKDSKDDESVVPEKQEPAESEEESADAQETATTPEVEDPAEPNDSAEPEEKTDPAETTEPSEEKTEQAEPSNSEEKIEPIESAEPESVELNNAKEWEIIRDSVTSVVENNSIQYLHETRSFRLDRSDKILRLDEYRMPKDDFVAEYQYDGYDQHLTDRLYEDEILWEGFNWTNLNKPECRFKAELDSVLTHGVWPEDLVEMEAVYSVRYVCQSLGLEGNVSIWIPVRYRAKQN